MKYTGQFAPSPCSALVNTCLALRWICMQSFNYSQPERQHRPPPIPLPVGVYGVLTSLIRPLPSALLTSYGHTRRGVTLLSAASQAFVFVHRLVFTLKTTWKWIAFHSSSMLHPFTRLSYTWVDFAGLHTLCALRFNVYSLGWWRDSQYSCLCMCVWIPIHMMHTFENKWNVVPG